MGEKGAKLTGTASQTAEMIVSKLSSFENVSSRKMFGGHGIFQDGKMFAIINSRGEVFFKVDDTNRFEYEKMSSDQHGKMPYYSVADKVLADDARLQELARLSIKIAHKA
jgi:DNA transformation protein